MYIHCLTKLILYDEFQNFPQFEGYSEDPSSDEYYKNIREKMFFDELKNSGNFAYSEVRLGKAIPPGDDQKENVYFLLFRNNIMVGKFKLNDFYFKGEMLKIESIKNLEDDKVITISVNEKVINCPFYSWSLNNKYQNTIKEIQIRCVKAFKKGEKTSISLNAQKQFKDYANIINQIKQKLIETFDGNLESLEEEAFKKAGPLKIENSGGKKAVGQKYRDLCDAIQIICCKSSRPERDNTRINYPIQIQLDLVFFKRIKKNRKSKIKTSNWIDRKLISPFHYDERTDVIKDFSSICTLHYENVNFSSINLQWFDAPALTWLTFNNCTIFETPQAWETFEENICKLENLHIFKITNCEYLSEIPATLFSKLPKTVDSLIFDGNNLNEISSEISKVKKLKYLNLERNFNLSDDGIPWEFLPENLEVLFVKNTNVTKIPAEKIERLKNLKRIDFPVYHIEDINADEFAKNFDGVSLDVKKPHTECLHVEPSGHTTFTFEPTTSKKKYGLTLNRRDLEEYSWETLSVTLTDLDLANNKLKSIGSLKHLKNLQTLCLAVNQISKIDGEMLPGSLIDINFSYNCFTDASFLGYLKNLKILWITDNQITTIPWEQLSENLEEIYICRNKLSFVGSMKHLKNLQTLSLLENEISSVAWVDLPEGLKDLDIHKNNIKSVDSMKHLKNLSSLNLAENQIISIEWESLPEGIERLEVFDNILTEIGSIQHLQQLEYFNARKNQLKSIAWEFLPESLYSLCLEKNALTRVGSIKQLKNLHNLELNNNQISAILWEDFPEFEHRSMSEINLSNNLLTEMGSLGHLKNIKEIRIEHNQITSIQWDHLPAKLKSLYLCDNQISNLIGSPKRMVKLETLSLEFNHLTVIDEEIFTLSNLNNLYLSNNALREIKSSSQNNLHNFYLPHLDLSNNAFDNDKENLVENLWNHLPHCVRLFLDGNNLVEIPCPLVGKVEELYAIGCNLEYICPKLTSYVIKLNIGGNPKYLLSLHPKFLCPSPAPKFDDSDFDVEEHPFIVGDIEVFANTKKFRKNKNHYSKVEPEDFGNKFFCKCCATCIKKDEKLKIVERIMVMDFFFRNYETIVKKQEEEEQNQEYHKVVFPSIVFNHEHEDIKFPSRWKTLVRTRICEECQKFTSMLIEGVNSKKTDKDTSLEESNAKKLRIEPEKEGEEENNSGIPSPLQCHSFLDNDTMEIDGVTDEILDCGISDFSHHQPTYNYHYDEPYGSSSKTIPFTNPSYPQQHEQQNLSTSYHYYNEPYGSSSRSNPVTNVEYPQLQQPEQYYHPNFDQFSLPQLPPAETLLPQNYLQHQNTVMGNNDGTMVETIVLQDSYGNHLMTAPGYSQNIFEIHNHFVNSANHYPENAQFGFSQEGLTQQQQMETFITNFSSTNIPPPQPYYFDDGQFVDPQQQQSTSEFTQLQNINNFDTNSSNTTVYNDPYYYDPQNL